MKSKNTLIITHDNCLNGIASEAILRAKYGDSADYLPLVHNDYNPKNTEGVSALLAKLKAYSDAKGLYGGYLFVYFVIRDSAQQ